MTPTTNPVSDPVGSHNILSEITVDHGPDTLLAPLFLRVEYAVRQLGVKLTFGTFKRLAAVNAANRTSWAPLFPVYDPAYWTDDADTSSGTFCLFAEEPSGRAIATLAVRIFDWPRTTLYDEAISLRLFGANPHRPAGTRCDVSAISTREVQGRVALAGAVWVHPDWRKHPNLMVLMPRFARGVCIARWSIDHYTLLMTEAVYKGGLTKKTGMGNLDWSVDLYGCSMGDIRLGLLRMDRNELHDDLSRCLVELGTQVDQRIVAHRANQQSGARR